MTQQEVRLGVLISGRGSNLEAILRKEQEGYFARARVACVLSDVADARGLQTARDHGKPACAFQPFEFSSKAEYEKRLVQTLEEHGVTLVLLAGYMRIVGPTLLSRFPQRILNIHPSLLPAFPGLHAQLQALEYGVKVSGCTVHFVDAGIDTGPIIAQRTVPVVENDTEETLSARILAQEHLLYSECVKKVTERNWIVRGRTVEFPDVCPF